MLQRKKILNVPGESCCLGIAGRKKTLIINCYLISRINTDFSCRREASALQNKRVKLRNTDLLVWLDNKNDMELENIPDIFN